MNNILKDLGFLLSGKISSKHIARVLGHTINDALLNYQEFTSELDFDLIDLMIKSEGEKIFYNKEFQDILMFDVLKKSDIQFFKSKLKIPSSSDFATRELILKRSKKKVGNLIVEFLGYDPKNLSINNIDFNITNEELFVSPLKNKYLSLHSYQKRVKDEVTSSLLNSHSSRMLIHMPTGSGKTKTCVESIVDFLRTRKNQEGFVIWFAHSNELCNQAYYSMKETWEFRGDFPIPIFRIFGNKEIDKEILKNKYGVIFVGFAKFNSLLKSKKDSDSRIRSHLSTNTELVVIDEAHKSLATTYMKAIDYVSSMPNCRVIGLTATPGRSNNIGDQSNRILARYFDNNIISITDEFGNEVEDPLGYLQNQNVLAKIEHKPILVDIDSFTEEELNNINLEQALDETHVNKIITSPIRNKILVDEIDNLLDDSEKDHVLVFACSVKHCFIIQKLLELRGIKSEVVTGDTPSTLRNKYISDFKAEKLRVLINFGVLTTGFDAPKLKSLVIARHTNSLILYSQMIGRALRGERNGGNKKNYIIDLVDNIQQLGSPDFLFTYWEDFWGKKIK